MVAQPLWNKQTDKIDHCVALYMRDHAYDLSYNLRTNWATLGPKLRRKIPVYDVDLDNFYLNLAGYQFEEMTKALQNPQCDCEQNQGDNINLNVVTGEVTYLLGWYIYA